MHRVTRTDYYNYSIWTACDAQGTSNEGYPKSWFFFETGGYLNRKVSFSVHRLHFLYAMVAFPSFRSNAIRCIGQSTASGMRTENSDLGKDCRTQYKICQSTPTRKWYLNSTSPS